ncbi:hypothetical protein [Mycolicibacterium chubuense]|uniref:hypothetical protein n=1 Tax=Mycolicibacterium chubuense TaxID=1800 RepID=UPI000303129A|nr:hypothetical protein [Mycolicibacterium chubuense]
MLAAVAVGAVGIVSAPAAHADESCKVDGEYLNLKNRELGYQSMFVQTDGTHFGPGIGTAAHGENPTYGTVSDSVFSGRFLSFTITWNDNKGRAHYAATVGDDGFAHGAADGPQIPINLWNAGLWDSTTHITCSSTQSPAAAHTLTGDVQLYDKPGGDDAGAVVIAELKKGDAVVLNGPCPIVAADATNGWCVITDTTKNKTGAVWGDFVSK